MKAYLPLALAALTVLPGCTTPYTSPVAVDRFVADDRSALSANDSIVVEAANLNVPPEFVSAVAREVEKSGYAITNRSGRYLTARVTVDVTPIDGAYRRSPVTVGAGGSTGTYGSGVGAGVGISLGGREAPNRETQLSVSIRDSLGAAVWEGRATLATGPNSDYASQAAAADALAAALFEGFPGENGVSYEVELD